MRKLIIFAVLLTLCGAVYAQTAAQFYNQALKTEDTAERLRLLTKAIEKNPKLTQAYHHRGDIYRGRGEIKKAIADYDKMISLSPKDPFKYYARGLAYMDRKSYAAAADDFSAAIKLKNNSDDFYYNRALAYMETDKYNDALKDLSKIKNRKAKGDELIILEGKAHLATYNYPAARRLFEQILAKDNNNTTALFYLGRINFNNEMYDEAISLLSKAINRDAAFAPAYRLRASAFKETGDYKAAADDYTALIAISPDYSNYNRRGLIYEETGEWQKAAQDFSAAIAANPKWAIAYNNRGYAYTKLKEYKKAQDDFETALKLAPNLPTPHINYAGWHWTARKDKKNMYKYLDLGMKYNFKDLDSLYEENKKGWMFKGINNTVEFRTFLANYSK